MSDNTMSTAASSPALSAAQTPAAGLRHDFASDKELMLAAITRMEAAVSGERAAHERLRTELAGMAEAIAHVKTSIRNAQTTGKPVNVLVLLTWLEARVNGIRGYLGATAEPTAPETVAEPTAVDAAQPEIVEASAAVHEAVPTVSDVVSRLGRVSDVLEKEAHALEQSAPAADDVPTVSMLGAMVEALTAPETVAAEPAAKTEAAPETEELAAPEQAHAEAAAFEVAPEAAMAEATAPETNAAETILEIVMDDPAPEVTAFAEELGSAEAAAVEAETAGMSVVERVQPETMLAEAVVADEPTVEASATEAAVETEPSAEAALLVAEPVEPETVAVAEAILPDPEAIAPEAMADETADASSVEMTAAETVAATETTAAAEAAHEPSAHEFELLTRFAAMEAIPFMRDEVGTAVIFEQKTEFDPAAEQMAFETPANPAETAAQTEAVSEQPEAVSPAVSEIEVTETATAETEPAGHVETHIEATSQTQPEMAVSAENPAMAVAPGPHPTYAGVSSLSVPHGAINATAALPDATEIETTSAGLLKTAAPVEASEPQTDAAEIPKIEFFEVDEPKTQAEAATTASGVIAESALDLIVAEPAPVELSEPVVAESAEATAPETAAIVAPEPDASAPETSSIAIETASAVETITVIETVADAKAESTEVVAGHGETAVPSIAETAVEIETASAEAELTIAGPSEAERAAFAEALAEMEKTMAAALEPETASVAIAEAPAEPATPVEIKAVAADESPAETPEAADDDLSDLFEPEPDAALDPNNILLGPSPVSAPAPAFTLDPATAAVLPMHDMALPEAPRAAPHMKLPEAAKLEVVKPVIPVRLHDPLAPLKAMSDEEKIALFS